MAMVVGVVAVVVVVLCRMLEAPTVLVWLLSSTHILSLMPLPHMLVFGQALCLHPRDPLAQSRLAGRYAAGCHNHGRCCAPPPHHTHTHTRAHRTVSPALYPLQVELCSTSTVTPDTSTRFKIAGKTGRVYELEAANSTDRDAWMETIIVAISHNTVSRYL